MLRVEQGNLTEDFLSMKYRQLKAIYFFVFNWLTISAGTEEDLPVPLEGFSVLF